jgi:peptide/nickel transport system ATP-binding protein
LPGNAYVLGGQIVFGGEPSVSRYRGEYWQLAESRIRRDLEALKAKLDGMPKTEDGSDPPDAAAIEQQIELLQEPLAETYRRYLEKEIGTLQRKIDEAANRVASGDAKARRVLGEATARYLAASQDSDLLAITRLKDGRLRGYHPKLNAIRWKQISIVFQGAMNALNPVYTVGDQIVEAIQAHEPLDNYEARERVKDLYKLVGIPVDRIDNYPHEYSGGMKQRAMIAMALALNPKLVIMDEPTTALDVITAAKIMDEVLALQKQLHMTLIIISHDVSTVAKVADRIAVMYAGQIVEEATSRDVFYRTLHPYTEGLLGAFPSVKGEKRRLEAIPGSPPSLLTPPGGCRFHPRCKYAKDICKSTEPPYVVPEPGHRALCHFSQDFFSQGGLQRS